MIHYENLNQLEIYLRKNLDNCMIMQLNEKILIHVNSNIVDTDLKRKFFRRKLRKLAPDFIRKNYLTVIYNIYQK